MAVGLRLDYENFTLADYETGCKALNFPADWPDGLLYHDSAVVDGKLRLYEAWESREKFDQFVADKLGAVMGEALGDRAEQPQITEEALHTIYLQP